MTDDAAESSLFFLSWHGPAIRAIVRGMEGLKQRVRYLRSILRRRGRSRDDADDLIQEAFLRLHVYCQTQDVQQQSAFLTRTVLNLSVDLHRKEHRELYADEPVETLALVDIRPKPDEDLVLQQRLTRVAAVLDGLGPRTRDIFVMHRIEGWGCSQIAQKFDISVSSVEKHIARAVLALMDELKHQ